MYVSIEGIYSEHFSAPHHPSPFLASYHVSCHAVFNFFSYDRKHDAAATAEHSKLIIELFQKRTLLYRNILMVLHRNTSVQLNYIYHQCWHMHITS